MNIGLSTSYRSGFLNVKDTTSSLDTGKYGPGGNGILECRSPLRVKTIECLIYRQQWKCSSLWHEIVKRASADTKPAQIHSAVGVAPWFRPAVLGFSLEKSRTECLNKDNKRLLWVNSSCPGELSSDRYIMKATHSSCSISCTS